MTLRVLISASLLLAQHQHQLPCAVRGLNLRLASDDQNEPRKGTAVRVRPSSATPPAVVESVSAGSKNAGAIATAEKQLSSPQKTVPLAEAVPTVLGSLVECTALAPPVPAVFVGVPVGGNDQSGEGKDKNAITSDTNVSVKTSTRRRRCCCRRKRSPKKKGTVSPDAQAEKYEKGEAEKDIEKAEAEKDTEKEQRCPRATARPPRLRPDGTRTGRCGAAIAWAVSDDPTIVARRELMVETLKYLLWIAYTAVGARIVDVYDPSLCSGGAGGALRDAVTGQLVSHAVLFFHHLARAQELRLNPNDIRTGSVMRVEPMYCCSPFGLAVLGMYIWVTYELIALAPSAEHVCSAVRDGWLWEFGLASIMLPAVLLCFFGFNASDGQGARLT